MARGGSDANIETKVIKVLERTDYEKGGATELRIISWVINGKERPPTLERREKWQTEDGGERAGKAKGLSASDLWLILENMREIGRLIGIPAVKIAGILNDDKPKPKTNGESTSQEEPQGEDAWDQ